MMAIVVRGDALNEEDVRKAFDQIEEVDAVVSTIGGTPADPTADSQVPTASPSQLQPLDDSRRTLAAKETRHGRTLEALV